MIRKMRVVLSFGQEGKSMKEMRHSFSKKHQPSNAMAKLGNYHLMVQS